MNEKRDWPESDCGVSLRKTGHDSEELIPDPQWITCGPAPVAPQGEGEFHAAACAGLWEKLIGDLGKYPDRPDVINLVARIVIAEKDAALEAERRAREELEDEGVKLFAKVAELTTDLSEARAALWKYGRHPDDCLGRLPDSCTCGLAKTLGENP